MNEKFGGEYFTEYFVDKFVKGNKGNLFVFTNKKAALEFSICWGWSVFTCDVKKPRTLRKICAIPTPHYLDEYWSGLRPGKVYSLDHSMVCDGVKLLKRVNTNF